MFGQPIVGFNMKAKTQIQTNPGAFMTILIAIVVLLYATIKFIHLNDKHNPSITEYQEAVVTDSERPINLNAIGFRAAFAFEGYSDEKLKDSPEFVRNVFWRYT